MTLYTPTQRFLSSTKPALQEHLKLPSVFRQSPFWQTPWMVHSLMSARSPKGRWGGSRSVHPTEIKTNLEYFKDVVVALLAAANWCYLGSECC